MASVIYPYPNNGLDKNPCQTKKEVCLSNNQTSTYPNGYIIAKCNRIEGIEARE